MTYIYTRCTSLSKKTFKEIKASWNDWVIQVKENQEKLLKQCIKIANSSEIINSFESEDIWRNRHEVRVIKVFKFEWTKERSKYINTVVQVKRERNVFDTKEKRFVPWVEISYYVSTILLSAEEFAKWVRYHRHIENKDHHVRDVSMEEDKSRIRVNPQNMSTLRSFALNILRVNWVENVKATLYENCFNLPGILNYKFVLN